MQNKRNIFKRKIILNQCVFPGTTFSWNLSEGFPDFGSLLLLPARSSPELMENPSHGKKNPSKQQNSSFYQEQRQNKAGIHNYLLPIFSPWDGRSNMARELGISTGINWGDQEQFGIKLHWEHWGGLIQNSLIPQFQPFFIPTPAAAPRSGWIRKFQKSTQTVDLALPKK